MAMLKMIAILLLAVPFQVPDFTGTWKLQVLDGANVVGLTAQLQPQLTREKALVVKQTAATLNVVREGSGAPAKEEYTLGGKRAGGAVWHQEKLVLTRTMELTLDGEVRSLEAQETWSLSTGGTTMKIRVAIHISKAQDYVVVLTYGKQ
jgi:hypothetical protein